MCNCNDDDYNARPPAVHAESAADADGDACRFCGEPLWAPECAQAAELRENERQARCEALDVGRDDRWWDE